MPKINNNIVKYRICQNVSTSSIEEILSQEKEFLQQYQTEQSVDYYVSFICDEKKNCTYAFVFSGTIRSRARDLVNYVFGEKSIEFETLFDESDKENITSYCICQFTRSFLVNYKMIEGFLDIVNSYDSNTVFIDAGVYFELNKTEIESWSVYRKISIPRCCVDVAALKESLGLNQKDELLLKTLENESGVLISGNDYFIMIGSKGETYEVRKSKFDSMYSLETSGCKITVEDLCNEFSRTPSVEVKLTGDVVSLLNYAKICLPKKLNKVYVSQIIKGCVKIYSTRVSGTNQYYLGEANDYITVDITSPTSIHIVKLDPFAKTYEKI